MSVNGGGIAASREWRTGWPVVVASFFGTYLCVTFLYSFGFFIQPLEQAFGWSRREVTLGMTLVTIVGALVHPVAGVLVDRFGPRRVALPAVILYSSAVALLAGTGSSVTGWWLRCALVGVAYGCTASFIWLSATVARFDRARGMAIAVVQLGPATAMTTLPLIVQYLMRHTSWRGALLGLAVGGLVVTLPAVVFLMRPRPGERESLPPGSRPTAASFGAIAGDRRFWQLVAAAAFATFGVNGLSVHFVPLLTDAHVTRDTALTVASAIGIGSICGRIGCGFLLDRCAANLIGAAAFCLPVLSCVLLALEVHSIGSLTLAAFLLGLALGTEVDCLAFIAARLFGLNRYATAVAILAAAMSTGSGTGPLLGAFINDDLGGYHWFLVIEMAVFLVGAGLIYSVGNRAAGSAPGEGPLPMGLADPAAAP